MKNMKKGFTLVEMLIVVVIIGILSAALLPRLQGAQASARDTARKADISTLGTAIVSYYNQKGVYPWTGSSNDMTGAILIEDMLKKQVDLSSLPADPTKGNQFSGYSAGLQSWGAKVPAGQYGYIVTNKNGISKGGFILMARPETEGGANFVEGYKLTDGDISNFVACTSFSTTASDCSVTDGTGKRGTGANAGLCCYTTKSQLRYVYIF